MNVSQASTADFSKIEPMQDEAEINNLEVDIKTEETETETAKSTKC